MQMFFNKNSRTIVNNNEMPVLVTKKGFDRLDKEKTAIKAELRPLHLRMTKKYILHYFFLKYILIGTPLKLKFSLS
jgi:hypothetical protein